MNKKPLFAVGVVLSMTLAVGGAVILAGRPSPACAANAVVSFNDDILPIFKGRCVDCHQSGGVGYEKSGLDLRTYAGVMKGTKFGSMVTPGNPDTSNLVWLLGLEGFARNSDAAWKDEAFNLRPRCDPRMDSSGSQRQLARFIPGIPVLAGCSRFPHREQVDARGVCG